MQSVWLVWDETDDYHPSLCGIYATEDAAKKAIEEERRHDVIASEYVVSEWTVEE